jgi:hypothetical protein
MESDFFGSRRPSHSTRLASPSAGETSVAKAESPGHHNSLLGSTPPYAAPATLPRVPLPVTNGTAYSALGALAGDPRAARPIPKVAKPPWL